MNNEDIISKRNHIIPIVKIDTDKTIIQPLVFGPKEELKKDKNEVFELIEKGDPNIIPGRYMVSNYGRVWDTQKEYFMPQVFNKPYNSDGTNNGYLKTKLKCYDSPDTLYNRDKYIHRLTLEAFNPEHPGNVEINHKDGDKTNNNIDNLEWVTKLENIQHAVKNGLIRSGEYSSSASLTNKEAEDICKMLQTGMSVKEIVEKTGASINVVKHIKSGKNYKLISENYNFPTSSPALSNEVVESICKRLQNNESPTNIAIIYNTNRKMIYRILNGESYTHISSKYDFSNYGNEKFTSDEKVHEICKLLQDGKSTKEIVNETGVGRFVVQKIRNGEKYTEISSQYTIPKARNMQDKLSEDQIRKVCELLQSGESLTNTSIRSGVKYQIVQNIHRRISYTSISKDYNW